MSVGWLDLFDAVRTFGAKNPDQVSNHRVMGLNPALSYQADSLQGRMFSVGQHCQEKSSSSWSKKVKERILPKRKSLKPRKKLKVSYYYFLLVIN